MSGLLSVEYVHPELGAFYITGNECCITGVTLPGFDDFTGIIGQNALLLKARFQLNEYCYGQRKFFDLPLHLKGTPFEISVWNLLLQIPYGATATYGEIAQKLGKPGAARAVGGACHRNLLPIFIPCHRVICTGNKIGGFAVNVKLKQQLLRLENENYYCS